MSVYYYSWQRTYCKCSHRNGKMKINDQLILEKQSLKSRFNHWLLGI